MKIIGHYPQEGEIERDPNLQALIEHNERLLSEDFFFESPFNKDIGSVSDIDPSCFDLNVDDIGLQDDFDLSEDLSEFVGKVREKDVAKTTSKCVERVTMILLIIVAVFSFALICWMWYGGRTYQDTIQHHDLTQQEGCSGVLTKSSTTNFNMVSAGSQNNVQIDLGSTMPYDQSSFSQKRNQANDQCDDVVDRVTERSYDWLIILFGIILSLALISVIIALAIHICKKDEREHEDQRLLLEYQNKMINEYANHLYSIKRVKLQQSETLLSLKQQYVLQLLDFQQRGMDMLKKEQDMAWKYKEEHLNAVKEYLLNLDYEMKQNTEQKTKQETGQETKQGNSSKNTNISIVQ